MTELLFDTLALPNLNISTRKLITLFNSLPTPPAESTTGFYQAHFVGNLLLRLTGKPTLALSQLPNWQGKRFINHTDAVNVILKNNAMVDVIPMTITHSNSAVDGNPCLMLSYAANAPIPWRWVRDDFRALNNDCLLGMTTVQLPLLNLFKFPFLLVRTNPNT